VIKDKGKAENRAEKATEFARKVDKELKEERAVSEGLMTNLRKMKEKLEHADKEKEDYCGKIRELEDQVRDVMFFLEAKTKIEQGDGMVAEAAGGSIEIPTPVPPSPKSRKKKSKK
jgi:BRCA1-associated protein